MRDGDQIIKDTMESLDGMAEAMKQQQAMEKIIAEGKAARKALLADPTILASLKRTACSSLDGMVGCMERIIKKENE